MLHDFEFNIMEFSPWKKAVPAAYLGTRTNILDILLCLHSSDLSFYFTGSRWFSSDHKNHTSDYDFYIASNNHSIKIIDRTLVGYGLSNTGTPYVSNNLWRSNNALEPRVDVFALPDRWFKRYREANYTIKDMEDAKSMTKEKRLNLFDELAGKPALLQNGTRAIGSRWFDYIVRR